MRYKAGTGTTHDENTQGPTDSTVENANSETKSRGQRELSTLRNPRSETNQDFTKKEFVSGCEYNNQNLTVSSVPSFHTTIFFYSAHFHSTVVSSMCILPLRSAKRTKHLSLMKFCTSTLFDCSFWTTDPIRKQPQGNIHVIQGSVTEESERSSFKHISHYLTIPALTSGLHYPSSPTQCHNLQGALPYDRAVGMWASLNMSSALGGPLRP